MIQKSDEELMTMIQSDHDHGAFSILVERHAHKFRALAYRYIANITDAEDIVQDAFIKLWSRPDMWKQSKGTKFTTWFYRIIVNQCLDFMRAKKTRPLAEHEEFHDAHVLQDESLIEKQRLQMVEDSFQQLPPNMQTALNLGFYEEIPRAEAASIMGMNVDAFKSLLFRSKMILKESVEKKLNSNAKNLNINTQLKKVSRHG